MRPLDGYYFFGKYDDPVQKSAITTLVTYRKRKTVVRHVWKGSIAQAMQKLYAMRCTPGTLHLPRKSAV